jgi:hypothetical protein
LDEFKEKFIKRNKYGANQTVVLLTSKIPDAGMTSLSVWVCKKWIKKISQLFDFNSFIIRFGSLA